jgi:hypothetical protein
MIAIGGININVYKIGVHSRNIISLEMTQSNENRLISCFVVFTYCLLCFGKENIGNNDFSFLYKCDWNVYNSTQLLHEMHVKSRIQCAVICLQYQTNCLGFELFRTLSSISCRFFREDFRTNCVSPSTSASSFYRRIDGQGITVSQTTTQLITTSSEVPTTSVSRHL